MAATNRPFKFQSIEELHLAFNTLINNTLAYYKVNDENKLPPFEKKEIEDLHLIVDELFNAGLENAHHVRALTGVLVGLKDRAEKAYNQSLWSYVRAAKNHPLVGGMPAAAGEKKGNEFNLGAQIEAVESYHAALVKMGKDIAEVEALHKALEKKFTAIRQAEVQKSLKLKPVAKLPEKEGFHTQFILERMLAKQVDVVKSGGLENKRAIIQKLTTLENNKRIDAQARKDLAERQEAGKAALLSGPFKTRKEFLTGKLPKEIEPVQAAYQSPSLTRK